MCGKYQLTVTLQSEQFQDHPRMCGKYQLTVTLQSEQFQDHPRMCGKYCNKAMPALLMIGSPPHVREIQKLLTSDENSVRITPACAGNTII